MVTTNNNFDPTTLPGVMAVSTGSNSSGSFDPTSLPGVTAVGQNPNNTSSLTPGAPGNTTGQDVIGGVGNFLFPIVGDIYHDIKGDQPRKSFLQHIGDLGLSALPFIPGLGEVGEAARVGEVATEGASALSKGADLWKGLSPVAKGATTGYGAGVATNLSQGKGVGESINPLDSTNIVGEVTGGIGAKVIPKLFAPFTNNLTQEGAINATQNALEEEANRSKSNKGMLGNMNNKGRDAFSLIAHTDSLPEVKGTNFDSSASIENMQKRISELGQVRAQALDKIGETQSLDALAKQAKSGILSIPADASPAEAHLIKQRMFSGETGGMGSKIDKIIADIKTAHGLVPDINGVMPDMQISASDLEAMKESQMTNSGIFKRSGAIGDQNGASMLGEAAKTNIEKMASNSGFPGMDEYNKIIGNHYDAIKILQKMDGQTVKGGRLGNMLRGHTAGLIGAGATSMLGGGFWGTLAGGAGMEGASHLFSKMLGETTLSNPLRDVIMSKIQTEDPEIVAQMQKFLGNSGKVAPTLVPKPTGKSIPFISSALQKGAIRTTTVIPTLMNPTK